MGKDYMVDIVPKLLRATFTQTMQQISDKTVQQFNWTLAILADNLVYRRHSTFSSSSVGDRDVNCFYCPQAAWSPGKSDAYQSFLKMLKAFPSVRV